jgi:hypothetical protein
MPTTNLKVTSKMNKSLILKFQLILPTSELTRMFIVHKQLLAAGKAQNTDASNIITN